MTPPGNGRGHATITNQRAAEQQDQADEPRRPRWTRLAAYPGVGHAPLRGSGARNRVAS